MHRDARLEPARGDDEDAGDQPECEAVDEDREALGPVRHGEEQRGHHDRHPTGAEEPAEDLREVAAERVLLPRRLEWRQEEDHERELERGGRDVVEVPADLAGVARGG